MMMASKFAVLAGLITLSFSAGAAGNSAVVVYGKCQFSNELILQLPHYADSARPFTRISKIKVEGAKITVEQKRGWLTDDLYNYPRLLQPTWTYTLAGQIEEGSFPLISPERGPRQKAYLVATLNKKASLQSEVIEIRKKRQKEIGNHEIKAVAKMSFLIEKMDENEIVLRDFSREMIRLSKKGEIKMKKLNEGAEKNDFGGLASAYDMIRCVRAQ